MAGAGAGSLYGCLGNLDEIPLHNLHVGTFRLCLVVTAIVAQLSWICGNAGYLQMLLGRCTSRQ